MGRSKGIDLISKIFISLLSFGLILFWIYLQFSGDKVILINYYFNLFVGYVYFFVGLMSLNYALGNIKPSMRNFLLAFGGALLSWSFGQFIWAYFNFVVQTSVPYPSTADLFYIGYSVLMGVAFWYYLDTFHAQITKASLRDSLIIIVGVYMIILFVLHQPTYGTSLPPLEVAANYLYPLLDATILSLAFITLRVGKIKDIGKTIFITLTILLQVIGDILFSYRTANDIYWNGDISDLFFLLSGIVAVGAVIQVYMGFMSQLREEKKLNSHLT